ncbi:MAG: prephenate dehydrogenase [Treponema sp.]|jgi:prephenate dehydrogenase|nr:prephenate dehydrogenase [Treponema sp.]
MLSLNIEEHTVGIVGLGLMGGAFAYALRRLSARRILACDISAQTLKAAQKEGCIDEAFLKTDAMLGQCDLVFFCLNPAIVTHVIRDSMTLFKHGALLTDITGIKLPIVQALEPIIRPDIDFIPGHPMAGSEKGGFECAKQCSFLNKNYILTPLAHNKPEHIQFLKQLIYRMGFSRITETTAHDHDKNIAFTSQLCHIIASALIHCQQNTAITHFGGGSFEDLTRIALLNVPLWTELFLENRDNLIEQITCFEQSLDLLKQLINTNNEPALKEILDTVRKRRSAMAEQQR